VKTDYRLPTASLRPLIARYWRWQVGALPWPLLPVMPGPGGMEVFFHVGAPFLQHDDDGTGVVLPAAHTLCVRRAPLKLRVNGPVNFMAVRFRPGAMAHFTRVSLVSLADRCIDAQVLWGASVRTLLDQLAAFPAMDDGAALLDRFFLAHLQPARHAASIDASIARLQREDVRIATLAQSIGLCSRQLENRFRDATGIPPVRLRRLARLQRSLRKLLFAPAQQPLTTLLDPGYFDQAQQIREFRELTGFSPGQLRKAAAGHAHFYNPPPTP